MLLCSGCRTFYWLLSITCIPFTFLLQEQVLTVLFINLYYLYCLSIFQRTCRFRFKSGCKGKRFIFNYQTFSEVFFYFFSFLLISQTLLRKGKNNHKRKSKTALFANRTAKIKTFIYMFQTFSELFCFYHQAALRFVTKSFVKAFFSWKAGAKVVPFGIHSKYILLFFPIIFE